MGKELVARGPEIHRHATDDDRMDSKGSRHRLDHGHYLKGAFGWVLDAGRASYLCS
jgi:hypothetical protein